MKLSAFTLFFVILASGASAQDVFSTPEGGGNAAAPGAEAPSDNSLLVLPNANTPAGDTTPIVILPYQPEASNSSDPPGASELVKAANEGSASAAAALGNMYMIGAFGEPDVGKAQYWLRRADQGGDARAPYVLGQIYEEGKPPMPKDMRQAIPYYQRAADRRDPDAQYRMYKLYRDGTAGIEKNPQKARYWLGEAAKNGRNPQVMLELADLVEAGKDGIIRDPEFAAQLRDEVRKMSAAQ